MKTYMQPEIEEILFVSETITETGNESGDPVDPLG